MFDLGFDKISSIIVSQSENAFYDLISKIKPTHHEAPEVTLK